MSNGTDLRGNDEKASSTRTLPSAHSSISSKGRSARYIVVVFHHIGSPRSTTISQKDMIT